MSYVVCFIKFANVLFTECKESKACAPFKHHFDECVERVTGAEVGQANKKGPHEDCVEECKYCSIANNIQISRICSTTLKNTLADQRYS